jgi:hypothetical protein
MAKLVLPFHSYEHRSRQVASRRLVNCFAELMPPLSKSPHALMRAPGIHSWVTLPAGPVRGMGVHKGALYVVAGSTLYSVSSVGTVIPIGAVSGGDPVRMASNSTQLVVVSWPNGYIYDGTLAPITDVDFTSRGASDVGMVDNFAIYVTRGSQRWFASDLDNASSIGNLSYADAIGGPDNLNSVLIDHRQIFLFGDETVEIWYNAGGDPDFPFLREQNGFIEVGCAAAGSPAKADNTVFWLDNHRVARRLNDYTPARISTHAIEQEWSEYATVSDATGFTFVHEGHWFYVLTFPSADATWVYDIATNEWHERSSRYADGHDGAWRVACAAYCYGLNLVGDTESSRIGFIDAETYTEWGDMLRMEWTYPAVYTDSRRAFHHRLQIDFQAGVGLTTGQGAMPEVMLYTSDDGGVSFTAVPSRSIGNIGEYQKRAIWCRLGSSRDRVYRAAVSDPVQVTVWDTQLEVEGGRL